MTPEPSVRASRGLCFVLHNIHNPEPSFYPPHKVASLNVGHEGVGYTNFWGLTELMREPEKTNRLMSSTSRTISKLRVILRLSKNLYTLRNDMFNFKKWLWVPHTERRKFLKIIHE